MTSPPITTADELYLIIDAHVQLGQMRAAWKRVRQAPLQPGDDGGPTRAQAIRVLLSVAFGGQFQCTLDKLQHSSIAYAVTPDSRPLAPAVERLAYIQFLPEESSIIHDFVIAPPATMPYPTQNLLIEWLANRLIGEGRYAQALQLLKRPAPGVLTAQARDTRKRLVHGLSLLLHDVQKSVLDLADDDLVEDDAVMVVDDRGVDVAAIPWLHPTEPPTLPPARSLVEAQSLAEARAKAAEPTSLSALNLPLTASPQLRRVNHDASDVQTDRIIMKNILGAVRSREATPKSGRRAGGDYADLPSASPFVSPLHAPNRQTPQSATGTPVRRVQSNAFGGGSPTTGGYEQTSSWAASVLGASSARSTPRPVTLPSPAPSRRNETPTQPPKPKRQQQPRRTSPPPARHQSTTPEPVTQPAPPKTPELRIPGSFDAAAETEVDALAPLDDVHEPEMMQVESRAPSLVPKRRPSKGPPSAASASETPRRSKRLSVRPESPRPSTSKKPARTPRTSKKRA